MPNDAEGYGFGFWPWMPCKFKGSSFGEGQYQPPSALYGKYEYDGTNVTRNMTIGIVRDIRKNLPTF